MSLFTPASERQLEIYLDLIHGYVLDEVIETNWVHIANNISVTYESTSMQFEDGGGYHVTLSLAVHGMEEAKGGLDESKEYQVGNGDWPVIVGISKMIYPNWRRNSKPHITTEVKEYVGMFNTFLEEMVLPELYKLKVESLSVKAEQRLARHNLIVSAWNTHRLDPKNL